MEEQASTGDLLQPTSGDFLGLLKVLGVRAVWVLLPGYTVELIEVTKSLSEGLTGVIIVKSSYFSHCEPCVQFTWLRTARRCSEKAHTAATRD